LLPVTVLDQIRIWENDKNRVRSHEGSLYEDFKSDADYAMVRDYARQLEVVLWESEPKLRKLFVTAEGHDSVRTFIKRRASRVQAPHARFADQRAHAGMANPTAEP
jgi:transcription initiation factor TFIIH subunit 4